MPHPEILAPAGGPDALLAALRCGADAVYVGSTAFSARGKAENFTPDALCRAVADCHLRGAKLYLALNTLVFDGELSQAAELIALAGQAGVDALIVQDLGIAALARRICPSLPLHGSTQMSVHTLSGALFLQKQGFSRVILARELSYDELRVIARGCSIETEVFVHGALCMSVSGQCYLSAVAGRRSGNRGLCAQPCRLPFTATPGDGACGLSLKDLSIIRELPALADIGVRSVKIEGRLKRPEYVAAAVSACVASRDAGLEPQQLERLQAVFSRSGFTAGYYNAKRDESMFGTRGKEDVASAAGVLKELARLYDREAPRVAVDFAYTQRPGRPISLLAVCDDGTRALAEGLPPEPAINSPTDRLRAGGAIEKLGGTPFYARNVSYDLDETRMVPNAQINALRRDCVQQLTARRTQRAPRAVFPAPPLPAPYAKTQDAPLLRARVRSAAQLSDEALGALEYLYLPADEILAHSQRFAPIADKLIACPPRAMFGEEDAVLHGLEAVRDLGVTRLYAPGLAAVELGTRLGMTLHGGFSLNAANSFALDELQAFGLADTELSIELDLARIRALRSPLARGLVAYGRLPLMLTRCCPLSHTKSCGTCKKHGGYLYDRLNNRFFIACEGAASEVFNCKPVYLADRLDELRGLEFLTLLFTDETPEQAAEVIRRYRTGDNPPEDFTRGLYYRGVL